ncbi:hypothetical protein AB1Y20_022424 [Prymnesium parvum]|uniref:Spindle and centriole-associated protein 1 n=1 Tax=Prymnesium parvum TaxID=97485 RepID=A0AB34JH40_PRYPA
MAPRRPWDSSIHDLSIHKASRREREARRERYRSPNAETAKAELARRREQLAARGSFDGTLLELSRSGGRHDDDPTKNALRELDQVEAELRILASDSAAPRSAPFEVRATFSSLPDVREEAYAHPARSEVGDTPDEPPSEDEESPAVDLNSEIALFRRRSSPPHADAQPPCAPPPPQQAQHPAPPPQKALPLRPAWGSRVPHTVKLPKAPPPDAIREPGTTDGLGLARLQKACAKMECSINSYEQRRGGGGGSASSSPPTNFSGCNAKMLELLTRLMGHLHRADAELTESQKLRSALEGELREAREALASQQARHDEEVAAVRVDLAEVRSLHGAELRALTGRIAGLEAARKADANRRQPQPSSNSRATSPTPPTDMPPLAFSPALSPSHVAYPVADGSPSAMPSLFYRKPRASSPAPTFTGAPTTNSQPTAPPQHPHSASPPSAWPTAPPQHPHSASPPSAWPTAPTQHPHTASAPYAWPTASPKHHQTASPTATPQHPHTALASVPSSQPRPPSPPPPPPPPPFAQPLSISATHATPLGADGAAVASFFSQLEEETPNSVRSQHVLQAYHDEVLASRHAGARRPAHVKDMGSAPRTSGGGKTSSRVVRSITPTQLFVHSHHGGDEASPEPRTALRVLAMSK